MLIPPFPAVPLTYAPPSVRALGELGPTVLAKERCFLPPDTWVALGKGEADHEVWGHALLLTLCSLSPRALSGGSCPPAPLRGPSRESPC